MHGARRSVDGERVALRGARHRPRHDAAAARAPVRAVQPPRRRARRHRRHRHRPGDRQGAGRAHGRHASRCSSEPGDGSVFDGPAAAARPTLPAPAPAERAEPRRAAVPGRAACAAGACSTSRTTRSTCCWSRSWSRSAPGWRSPREADDGAGRRRRARASCGPTSCWWTCSCPTSTASRCCAACAPTRAPRRSAASRCRPTRCPRTSQRALARRLRRLLDQADRLARVPRRAGHAVRQARS